jgi:tetratricopeptide (TPR) repeat protein
VFFTNLLRSAAPLCLLIAVVSGAQESAASIEQLAINLIQSGHPAEASRLLLPSVKRFQADVNLWNLLGIADTEAGNLKSARDAFERGLALAPKSAELNENIGLLFFRQGDYSNAKKYLSAAVNLGSSKPGVLFSLAAARLRTGEPTEALSQLISLESALNNNSDYWDERGRAELFHDSRRAADSFDRALAITPDNVPALNDAATAAERQGLDDKALAYLIRARRLAPDDVPTLLHFGSVCIRRDLGPDADDALERAHNLDPSSNTALYLLARANISLQNWQQAYNFFEQFSQRVPNYAPAYYAMGWLDVRLNRLDDARRQLERALTLDATLCGARYQLAQLDLDDGQMDVAEKSLRIVLASNPKDAEANMTLGDIMMRRGKLDEAERLLSNAVEQDPNLGSAHYKLSILLFRKHDLARADREKAIAANLNADARQAAKTQLKLILPDSDNLH